MKKYKFDLPEIFMEDAFLQEERIHVKIGCKKQT